MAEYIEREDTIEKLNKLCERVCQYSKAQRKYMCGACPLGDAFTVIEDDIPAADVRPVGLLEQVEWERDTALAQLAEIGKSLGEKMDDVRPVVRGRWEWDVLDGTPGYRPVVLCCSNCHRVSFSGWDFCPNCGADMRNADD